jgi:hypothetical protein
MNSKLLKACFFAGLTLALHSPAQAVFAGASTATAANTSTITSAAQPAAAAATPALATTGVATSTTELDEPKSWRLLPVGDLSLGYGVMSNLNQSRRPRVYRNELHLGFSTEIFKETKLGVDIGAEYATINGEVYRDTSTDPYFDMSDVGVSLSRGFKVGDRHTFGVGITEAILTSETSRFLGYRSVTVLDGTYGLRLFNWLSLDQKVGAAYILNRYKYAVAAVPSDLGTSKSAQTGDINKDMVLTYKIGPTITLFKKLKIGTNIALNSNRYMDNTYLFNFGNTYRIGYGTDRWQASLSYVNFGYADRGESNLWFVDPYRRVVAAGLSVNF